MVTVTRYSSSGWVGLQIISNNIVSLLVWDDRKQMADDSFVHILFLL